MTQLVYETVSFEIKDEITSMPVKLNIRVCDSALTPFYLNPDVLMIDFLYNKDASGGITTREFNFELFFEEIGWTPPVNNIGNCPLIAPFIEPEVFQSDNSLDVQDADLGLNYTIDSRFMLSGERRVMKITGTDQDMERFYSVWAYDSLNEQGVKFDFHYVICNSSF